MTYVFGADVGGTTVKLGLFEIDENKTSGGLIADWEIKTRTENNGEAILPDISEAIFQKMKEDGIAKEAVLGIGIGVPGPVFKDGTINKAINLGWGVFNIEEKLSELTGFPVKAGNDANVATLGEMWKGGGEGFTDLVMLTLGTGVGGGVIVNGRIYPGKNGASGEIGHIPLFEEEDEPDVCGCGKRGCLEQYTSANGMVRVAKRYLAQHPDEASALRSIDPLTSKDLFEKAAEGDAVAEMLLEQAFRNLGKAAAIISAVVDPEVFVIGGGVSKAGEVLTDGIKKYYDRYAFHASRGTQFRLAKLGNKAGIYGCAKMILNETAEE